MKHDKEAERLEEEMRRVASGDMPAMQPRVIKSENKNALDQFMSDVFASKTLRFIATIVIIAIICGCGCLCLYFASAIGLTNVITDILNQWLSSPL